MDFLKKAANATKAAAIVAADAAKATYKDLKSYPTQVRCSACPYEIPVPPTAFDYTCTAGHVNKRHDEVCTECKVAQPPNLPEPTVTCPSCQTVTVVPISNARKHARETATKTKEFAVATAAATKQGIEHMRAAPTTFHCAHCDNEEAAVKCKQCGQKKSDQKAICGVCRQSTVIPASNFTDSLKSSVKSATQSSKKVYYDVASKPYITCGKCQTHVSVEKKDVHAAAPGTPSRSAPKQDGEGVSSAPGGAAAASADPSAAAAAQASAAPEGVYHGETVVCPNCKNPIEDAPAAQ